MLRLGMMTRLRCHVVGLAGRSFNPKLRMLMVVNPIDAMLTTWLKLPAAGITRISQLVPLIGFRDRRPSRDQEK
jgi:hypothetical protein